MREGLSFKKKGPPAPSQRKLALDITGRRKIGLSASAALEDGGKNICRRTFLLKKKSPPAPSQRKLTLDITGRRKINLNASDAKGNNVCSARKNSSGHSS